MTRTRNGSTESNDDAFNEPLFDGNEKKYMNQCVVRIFISSAGPFVKKLGEGFSSHIGLKRLSVPCPMTWDGFKFYNGLVS